MEYKIGKRAPSPHRDAVNFSDFLLTMPTAPIVDAAPQFNYPMDLNDQIGDCVVAGFDHFRQIVSGLLTGTQVNFTQDQILAFYKTQNPNFVLGSATHGGGSMYDGGMNIQTFLEYLVNEKYILGFARVDWTNQPQFQAAIYIGLCLMAGVQLQNVQMQQFDQGLPWDYVHGAAVDGGHCPPVAGYNGAEVDMITWAKVQKCTPAFIANLMDECWFVLTQAHIDHPGFRNHFDLVGFAAAVKAITNGKIIIPTMQTYKHFTMNESTGGGHTFAELNAMLRTMLDSARDSAGVSFSITSGMRTAAENAAAGGAKDSTHLLGEAADIACTDATRWAIVQGALAAGFKRIEVCPNHVHMDIGQAPAYVQNWLGVATTD